MASARHRPPGCDITRERLTVSVICTGASLAFGGLFLSMEKLSGGGFNQEIWPSVSTMPQNKLDIHAYLNIPASTVHPTNLYVVVIILLAVTT